MKLDLGTREVADLSPAGDLASCGAPCVGLDLMLDRGWSFGQASSRTPRLERGAVALLAARRGHFGWRLTGRQAAALIRAGFTYRWWV
jgi:hypothetical protein